MTHISHQKIKWFVQYATSYNPGPVVPPRADGASLGSSLALKHSCKGGHFVWQLSNMINQKHQLPILNSFEFREWSIVLGGQKFHDIQLVQMR